MKYLLKKMDSWTQFRTAMLEWRNTPRFDGLSPAQWLFGRRQRTSLPTVNYDRLSNQVIKDHEGDKERNNEKVKDTFDRSTKESMSFKDGSPIVVQDHKTKRWDLPGHIIKRRQSNRGRTYIVEVNGRQYVRNRRFIRPRVADDNDQDIQDDYGIEEEMTYIPRRSTRIAEKCAHSD